jgi:hypothetical protein
MPIGIDERFLRATLGIKPTVKSVAPTFSPVVKTTAAGASGGIGTGDITMIQLGWINVKDYGAVGDGVTNDTTSVADAVAAMTDGCVLYFPPGTYLANGTGQLNNLNNVTVMGAGMGISIWKSVTPGVMIWANAAGCDNWNVRDITLDSNYTARTSGGHCLYLECSQCVIDHVEVLNAGQFAILIEDPDNVQNEFRNIQITNCRIVDGYADGIHVVEGQNVVISNNIIDGADDDCIAVFDCVDVVIANNVCRARTDVLIAGVATTWGRGIAVLRDCERVLVHGNVVSVSKQDGILVSADGSVDRPSFITLSNNLICGAVAGAGINIQRTDNIRCLSNDIAQITGSYGYFLADINTLLIQGGSIIKNTTSFTRGIYCSQDTVDSSAVLWATAWSNWSIQGVAIHFPGVSATGGECIHIVSNSGITLTNLLISGVTATMATTGNYIYTKYLAGIAKIVNNTELNGRGVGTGGTGSAPTTANNN